MLSKSQFKVYLVAASLFPIFSLCASAGVSTWYVSPTSPSDGPGTAWSNAFHTIQGGVDAANSGDTVLVTNGTYTIDSEIEVTEPIIIQSVNGPSVTTVNADDACRGFYVSADAIINGLTIRRGYTEDDGAGVYLDGGGTLTNCVMDDCEAYECDGGGVYCYQGGILIDCVFYDNEADDEGGGAYLYEGGLLTRCTFEYNEAEYSGGAVFCDYGGELNDCVIYYNYAYENGGGVYCDGGGTLNNCTIFYNTSYYYEGGGVYCDNAGTLNNCTIFGNESDYGTAGGAYCSDGGVFLNCIIWGNTASNATDNWGSDGGVFSNCCTIPEVGENCVTNDPSFAHPELWDLHLRGSSPCINAGTNQAWMAGGTDFDGSPRITGPSVDIGAYEYFPLLPFFEITSAPTVIGSCSNSLGVQVAGTNNAATVGSMSWSNKSNGASGEFNGSTDWVSSGVSLVYGGNLVVVTATNVNGFATHDEVVIIYTYEHACESPTHYVSHNGAGEWPYTSWQTAATNLQDAIEAAGSGDEVWIAEGLYYPEYDEGPFRLKPGVHLCGGFTGSETSFQQRDVAANLTVLSGDVDRNDVTNAQGIVVSALTNGVLNGVNSYHVLYGGLETRIRIVNVDDRITLPAQATSNRIDGLVITSGGDVDDNHGGGIYCATNNRLLVCNTTICGNKAGDDRNNDGYGAGDPGYGGGGIYVVGGHVELRNSRVSGNMAGRGSKGDDGTYKVIYDYNGQTGGIGGVGGGLCVVNGSLTVENSLVTKNAAGKGGNGGIGIHYSGNGGDGGPGGPGGGIYLSGGTLAIAGSTIADNYSGEGGEGGAGATKAVTAGTPGTNGVLGVAGGIYCSINTDGTLENTIVISNSASLGEDVYLENNGNVFEASYCLIPTATCAGDPLVRTAALDTDPLFVDPTNGNYRLQPSSPCVDSGDNVLVGAGMDMDGVGRPLDGDNDGTNTIDMGCYEFVNDSADSDGDGLTDAMEVDTYGSNPASDNSDGDRMDDADEVVADTDLTDPDSYFLVEAITSESPVTIWFETSADRQYTVQRRTDIIDGVWTNVTLYTAQPGSGGLDSYTDTNPTGPCYYRVKVGYHD